MGEYSSGMNRKGVLKVIELQLKIELSDFPCLSNTLYFNHEMLECNLAGKETCVELQWQATDTLLRKFVVDLGNYSPSVSYMYLAFKLIGVFHDV